MSVSLFKRLVENHPEAVVCLSVQYRMNADILSICNHLIYEHRLECGNEEVASARIHLKSIDKLPSPVKVHMLLSMRDDWLFKCIHPQQSVVFLNTDTYIFKSESESEKTSNINNLTEIDAIFSIVTALNVLEYDILNKLGIISPYRSQVNSILKKLCENKALLSKFGDLWTEKLQSIVSTVDRYQVQTSLHLYMSYCIY